MQFPQGSLFSPCFSLFHSLPFKCASRIGLESLHRHTYPHGEDGLCVITQRSGEMSELVKLLLFMSLEVILGKMAVISIALLVLTKYQGFLPASLDIIRLITSVSMRRLPRHSAGRVFFSQVFLLFLIINALIQSHWASLLTVPVSRPNINTSEDLKVRNTLRKLALRSKRHTMLPNSHRSPTSRSTGPRSTSTRSTTR